jgi:phosphoribosylformimino-5-aminoimidazole carboxamide ribotide isomerase
MLIFPAIDLRGGRCVRLTVGDFAQQTTYDGDPAEMAAQFAEQGAPWIHVVDLDGAKEGEPRNLETVRRIVESISIPVQFGGGVRRRAVIDQALEIGVARVILGSRLARDLAWAREVLPGYGERVVAGIDTREGKVAVAGWQEESDHETVAFARYLEDLGAQRIIFTDIHRDGTLGGPNMAALNELTSAVQIPVIASGGVGSLEDLKRLSPTRVEGVIVGKALYEGRFTVAEAVAS